MDSYYTTSQAAKLLSVSPDTVLRWVKAGKISSYRTPGGHARIPVEAIVSLLPRAERGYVATPQPTEPGHAYCWEHYADREGLRQECLECLTYKSQARRCYDMRGVPEAFGSLRLGCQSSCDDCDFYELTRGTSCSVLVISRNASWMADLAAQARHCDLQLKLAGSEYECGAIIERFRPDYIVVDRSFGSHRTSEICRHLNDDHRIPFTRIVLASRQARWADHCEQEVHGWIEKPFTLDQLGKYIEGTSRRDISDAPVI